MSRKRRIAVLTGGGDAPGLNAAIYAVVRAAFQQGMEVLGVRNGFDGFLQEDGILTLDPEHTDGLLSQGGTVLGTINRGDPFRQRRVVAGQEEIIDISPYILQRVEALRLDAVIVIGGEGTLRAAYELFQQGFPVVGIPKTIDNDVPGTEQTIGFATAVEIATQALDRVRTTAASLRRILVVELMGRHAGFLALHAGVAGGADIILLPELPFDYDVLVHYLSQVRHRGRHFSIIAAAEGSHPRGGEPVYWMKGDALTSPRLGGIARVVAETLEQRTGIEARWMVLSYLQRGGPPVARDRLLAIRFATMAVELAARGQTGTLTVFRQGEFQVAPLDVVTQPSRQLSPEDPLLLAARKMGIVFGDA